MSKSSKQKCEELIAGGDLTEGRQRLVESVASQIQLNKDLYPSVRQREIIDALYREHLRNSRSQAEQDAAEYMGYK